MSRLSWTRWLVAGAVFLLIGWAMGRFGMNAARIALVLLLLLVYRYGGHGRPPSGGSVGPTSSASADGRPESGGQGEAGG